MICFNPPFNLKTKIGNDKKSFNHAKHKNDTELSKEFWEIKKHNGTPKITWKLIRTCHSNNPNSSRCLLCLNEKYKIATYKGDNILNKRTSMLILVDTEVSTNLPIVNYRLTSNPSSKIPLQSLVLNCNVILCKLT